MQFLSPFSNNQKGVLFACITATLWGFLSIALKVSLNDLDSVTIVWFRFTFAFLVLFIYFLLTDPKQFYIMKSPPPLLLIAAAGLGLNYLGYMQGVYYTGPNNAQIIIQTGPILLALVGFIFFKEKINRKQVIGFCIAATGLYLFYQNQLQQFINDTQALNKGFIWLLTAALAWVLYASLQKKLVEHHHPQVLNMVLYGVPSLIYLPMIDFEALQNLSLGSSLLLIFLGINTLAAYGCIALALKYTQAYKISIIITLNPIITLISMAILSYLQVGWIKAENLTIQALAGALLVLGGAIIAVYFSRKNRKNLKTDTPSKKK